MRSSYPSRKAFEEKVAPSSRQARKRTKPTTVDLYEVFNGVLYTLKSGCQWRMLPSDLPKWRSCYDYWQQWSAPRKGEPSLLEEALKNTVGALRHDLGRDARTTFLIVDAQSVRNTDTAEEKGDDGGKLVTGIKRHVGVDTNGLPHVIRVTRPMYPTRPALWRPFDFTKTI